MRLLHMDRALLCCVAGFVMVTALTVFANAIGIGTAYLTAVLATDIKWFDFRDGLHVAALPCMDLGGGRFPLEPAGFGHGPRC